MTVAARSADQLGGLELRMMTLADVGTVPIGHQGDADEVRRRIEDLGSSAVLAFDGGRHVAQLQLRRYRPGERSPSGLDEPMYWMDFDDHAPSLPEQTIAVFCYHVGQTDDSDARDPHYWGRGMGVQLLDVLVGWAADHGYAIVAKGVPAARPVMTFLGGQPSSVYESRGFTTAATWVDAELRAVVARDHLAPPGDETTLDDHARVACCVKRLT
jgi:GNAT superfamily N-acetyltransferase